MAISINRIVNANVYFNGISLMGKAEEVQLPSIKIKMVEHKALGLVANIEFPAGIEKLEGKIKWTSFYADVLKQVANPFQTIQVQVRGSLSTWQGQGQTGEVPVVAVLTILPKGLPGGNFKAQDNVELETDFACYFMKLTVGGEDIVEIDVLANIYKAGGQDLLAQYRANLGG